MLEEGEDTCYAYELTKEPLARKGGGRGLHVRKFSVPFKKKKKPQLTCRKGILQKALGARGNGRYGAAD